jgi:hypothetical protein
VRLCQWRQTVAPWHRDNLDLVVRKVSTDAYLPGRNIHVSIKISESTGCEITESVLTSDHGRVAKISVKHLGREGYSVDTGPSLRVRKVERRK